MDIRQLKYFLTIVAEGSFSKAASKLKIAQPALSLHVRNMEADLGTELLFRTPQGVIATEAGKILARDAKRIIAQLSLTKDEIRGHASDPSGEVRLGLPGTISQIFSVPLVIEAKARFPKIRLCIAEAMSGFISEWLREDRVDLAVLYSPDQSNSFATLPILREELCVFGAADAPLIKQEGTLSFSDIMQLPLILPSSNHGLRELLECKAADANTALTGVIEVDAYSSIKQLVAKGLGYSILPMNAIAQDIERGTLRALPPIHPTLDREVHLVYPNDRPLSVATKAVLELCQETLTRLVTSEEWRGATLLTS